MPQIDPYRYRVDGNFFVHTTCEACGKEFDEHALANAAYGTYCLVCRVTKEIEKSNAAD